MTDALKHRGPDGCGYLIKGNLAFGHRRLSIIDVSGGDQPIYNEDGRIGIVFNGEIYNYVELMADLRAQGHIFATHSDTEVIVHLYEQYGERCVDHLRGMFTFAIWDGRDNSVFIARDRLGIKPLFYCFGSGKLLFASELKAILAYPDIPRTVNPQTVAEYLAYGYVPGDRCIINGISKLGPAHTLTYRQGRINICSYWDVDFSVVSPEQPGVGTTPQRLLDRLREATRLHLRSDVPVGVFLSGGVDSSTVVALASLESGHPVKTFSVGFNEDDYSELEMARIVADQFHTDHHEILVSDADVSVLPDLVWHLDEPFADPSALPTYYLCREAARHVKVCLSGDGADEIFAGYARYRSAMMYRYIDWLPRPIRRFVFGSLATMTPHAMWGKGFLRRMSASGAERYLDSVGVIPVAECSQILENDPWHSSESLTRYLDPYFAETGRNVVTTLQHADQKTYLVDDILVKVDRMSMQNSLEVRPPFLDHKVVEFANRCPAALKLQGGVGKAILKQAMSGLLPAEILSRRKMGFGMPIKHWFRGSMDSLAREMLLGPSSRTRAFFRPGAVEKILTGHRRGLRDLSGCVWSLLVFEQWCRSFGI